MSIHRATIKDVAKRAGVSLSTASLALSLKSGVSEMTRQKIMDAAKELDYFANASARSLRAAKTRVIGVIVPDITNIFFSTMLEMLRLTIEQFGYFLLIGITGNKIESEKRYVFEFISRNVDGVICIPMLKYSSDVSHIRHFAEYGIPVVFLSAAYPEFAAPCVMCDLAKGSYDMTRYLLQKGLTQMALIAGDRLVDNDYIAGFKRAFLEQGLPFDETAIYESEFSFESAFAVTKKILAQKPEAILAVSDLMACAAVQAARAKRLNIPRDISIVGYDDVLYSTINQIQITTVHQPIEEMCKRATQILIDMIENEAAGYERELLEPHIVIRETTKR